MAELPELEVLRRDLEKELHGKKIKAVDVTVPAVVKRNTNKKQFAAHLDGVKFTTCTRKGTHLAATLDSGEVLMVSIGERARLVRAQNRDAVAKGTAVTITFTQHGQLRLIDPAKKSEMFVVPAEQVAEVVGEVGFDLVDEPVSWISFAQQLLKRSGKLKAILMDPTFLVGVGPIYSDEILFEAGLRFDRNARTLSHQEIRRLYRAAVEIIHDAVKYGGTTLGDDGFVDLLGRPGEYQTYLNVYRRDGEMSPRARGPIIKARFGSGYTYYCEQTQM